MERREGRRENRKKQVMIPASLHILEIGNLVPPQLK